MKINQEIGGYIKKVRDDNKIDLSLQLPGYKSIDTLSRKIMETLHQRGGFIDVNDNSKPTEITNLFGVSKRAFKTP